MRRTIRKNDYKVTIYFKDGTEEVMHESSWLSIEQLCDGLREKYDSVGDDEMLIEKLTVQLIDS